MRSLAALLATRFASNTAILPAHRRNLSAPLALLFQTFDVNGAKIVKV
jgi:hypothetical protein